MSDTSHNTAALQRILTDTDPDPAGLFDLVVSHYTDPGAVEALCNHAAGSFPLLVALFAGSKHHKTRLVAKIVKSPSLRRSLLHSDAKVRSLTDAMFASATEPALVEGLRTAHSGLPDGTPSMLVGVSRWFAGDAPLEALTDRVIAEMAWRFVEPFCPELGAGPLPDPETRFDEDGRIRGYWLMSRYLYNRFGEHGPSWDVFRQVHRPSQTIGEAADTVAYLHTRFGEHGPSWEMFTKVHGPSQTVDDTANLVVTVQHG